MLLLDVQDSLDIGEDCKALESVTFWKWDCW